MTRDMGKGLRNTAMETPMKDCLKEGKPMEKGFTNGKMGKYMKEGGLMGLNMEMDHGKVRIVTLFINGRLIRRELRRRVER